MPDFTLKTYYLLLSALKDNRYLFQTFRDFIKSPAFRSVILRHDVDARKMNSLRTAHLENELGIRGTYYFRMVPESFDDKIIKQICDLGHEIGYHYEDLSITAQRHKGAGAQRHLQNPLLGGVRGGFKDRILTANSNIQEEELCNAAIKSFIENLAKLRRVVPVETICMHGSPLSRWDNRLLWKYYDYRDFGIVGEPYLDINFDEVLYLTDTGRRWDGGAVSIRDRAYIRKGDEAKGGGKERSDEVPQSGRAIKRGTTQIHNTEGNQPSAFSLKLSARFHSSFDIIRAVKANQLPDRIMITVHPQRWDDRPLQWIREFVWQNVKNIIKRMVIRDER